MSKIVVTRGLPASGKSTWAKAWVAADPSTRLRVNRDDIRFMLYGAYWGDGVDELQVTLVEEATVREALKASKDVVIDATHLKASYIKKWYNFGVPVEIKEFVVPLIDLTDRDIHRAEAGERSVGAQVILDLAKRFNVKNDGTLLRFQPPASIAPEFKPYVPGKIPAYSFDVDGTLARMVDRGPYETHKYHTDVADTSVIQTLWAIQDGALPETEFLIMSGRSDAFRGVLEEWLDGWGIQIPRENIYMRASGDGRNDAIVKSEMVDNHISGVYDVIMHFDDRNRVVDALRAKGMKVAQVEPGDF
jgi:predicted kinase